MHRRRIPSLLTVAALASLAVGGCGDDSGGTAAPAAATTTVQQVTTAARTVTTTAPDTTVTVPTPTAATTTPPAPDDATGGTTDPGGTARAAYITRADRLCRTANATTLRLNTRANAAIRGAKSDADRLAKLAPILEEGLRSQRAATDRFLALAPPAADRATIERYRQTLRQQLTVLGDLAAAASAGDVPAYTRAARRSATLRERSRALARAFGFTECGSGKSDAA